MTNWSYEIKCQNYDTKSNKIVKSMTLVNYEIIHYVINLNYDIKSKLTNWSNEIKSKIKINMLNQILTVKILTSSDIKSHLLLP